MPKGGIPHGQSSNLLCTMRILIYHRRMRGARWMPMTIWISQIAEKSWHLDTSLGCWLAEISHRLLSWDVYVVIYDDMFPAPELRSHFFFLSQISPFLTPLNVSILAEPAKRQIIATEESFIWPKKHPEGHAAVEEETKGLAHDIHFSSGSPKGWDGKSVAIPRQNVERCRPSRVSLT